MLLTKPQYLRRGDGDLEHDQNHLDMSVVYEREQMRVSELQPDSDPLFDVCCVLTFNLSESRNIDGYALQSGSAPSSNHEIKPI